MLLNIQNLHFQPSADFGFHIDDFNLATGETLLLLGPSGSGKTSLLSLISGVAKAKTGRIEIEGQDIQNISAAKADQFRGDAIGLIFQTLNLLPYATVLQNVLLGLSFSSARRKRLNQSAELEATSLLSALGLDAETLVKRKATQLSVGQQQRVAAARAMIGTPPLILADEPTSALDQDSCALFVKALFGTLDRDKQGLIMVSHDKGLIPHFDRVVEFEELIS